MAITVYNLKKWYKMLIGQSIMHVDQNIGRIFLVDEIKGYYNDLTKKVTEDKEILYSTRLPRNVIDNGDRVLFPTQIFQYGLGSFDLYLLKKEDIYLKKFKKCLEWAYETQQEDGAWNNFYFIHPKNPYSAMSQGEGASLLIRGFKLYKDEKYIKAANRAINFMLKHVSEGGTASFIGNEKVLLEYTHQPVVLNGLIFALFGLYDFILVSSNNKYKDIFYDYINSLKKLLPRFDNGYWSMYNCEGMIASLFYHKLHIAQLYALYAITNENIFKEYAIKWERYLNTKYYKNKAFFVKVFQKILEKK